MEKLILLALTAVSIFLTNEMAQWLGLISNFSQRDMEKLIGIDRSTPSSPDDSSSGRQWVIADSKSFLLLLFVAAVGVSGLLVVATLKALFS